MANSSDFNLSQAKEDWKSSLATTAQLNLGDIKELESHLEDTIDELSNHELSTEERFIIAKHRIGSPQIINTAFENRSDLSFQKLSGIGQAITYFLTFKLLSQLGIGITDLLYIGLKQNNDWVYLSISIVFQGLVIASVFLIYKMVQQSKLKKLNEVRANGIAISSLLFTCLIYVLSMMVLKLPPVVQFPVMQVFFNYLIVITFFTAISYKSLREWTKIRKLSRVG